MLKTVMNAVTRLHSRTATLKRLGTLDIYSPCRITPSNYFRFLRGPEYTTIKGVEFIIPLDTMTGQFSQLLTFSAVPDDGSFKIKIGTFTTAALNFNSTASTIQAAIRASAPLSNVVVTGNFSVGFTILFAGFQTEQSAVEIVDNGLLESLEAVDVTVKRTSEPWSDRIKKSDRIMDGSRLWVVDEVIELHDLGAQVMAYRVRCD